MIAWLLACAAPETDAAEVAVCPGPYGREIGDPAEDVVLTDCAGVPASVHGLCGKPAVIANWYGWCPSCETHAKLVRGFADDHPELAVAVVLNEDPLAKPTDRAFCDAYESAYPSAAAVWMDPDDRFESYGTTDFVMVLSEAGVIRFARETATEAAIEAAIEDVLSE